MARYELLIRKSVLKDLESIPRPDVRRILTAIESLRDNAHPPQSKKLSGQERYRLRCGVYRILYSIEQARLLVEVVKVGHRKDVYRP